MSTKIKLIVAAALAARSGLDQRADPPPARANNDASVD
jgi:hypothetical protein